MIIYRERIMLCWVFLVFVFRTAVATYSESLGTQWYLKRRYGLFEDEENPLGYPEKTLFYDLMRHYDPATRPVYVAKDTIIIKIGLVPINIFELNEKQQFLKINTWFVQQWRDERLVWNPINYDNLTSLRLPSEYIWNPDIMLYNSAEDPRNFWDYNIRAMINFDGTVFLSPPSQVKSICMIDVTYFPFDSQTCFLKFGSWAYHGFEINVTLESPFMDLSNYMPSGEFQLIQALQQEHVKVYTCCPEPYPHVIFMLRLQRKTLFYFTAVIVPCTIMSFLAILTFRLPSNSNEKISLGITVFLSFAVNQLLIAEKTPETSESIPIITMCQTCLSILFSGAILTLHYRGATEVPNWIKVGVLYYLRRGLCISADVELENFKSQEFNPKLSNRFRRNVILSPTLSFKKSREHRESFTAVMNSEVFSSTKPKSISTEEVLSYLREVNQYLDMKEVTLNDHRNNMLQWRLAGVILDRLLFYLFLLSVTLTALLCLLIIPMRSKSLVETIDWENLRVSR